MRILKLAAAFAAAALLAVAAPFAHAAPPPANSVIGNQATATYTDATGTQRLSTSNLVQTTVAQVYSHTLTADQSKTVAPGGTVYFPHTLTNTGNGSDSYALSTFDAAFGTNFNFTSIAIYADANGDGIPDNATPITTSGPLVAGGTFRFVVAATVPVTAAGGSTDRIHVGTAGNAADASNYAANATAPAVAGGNMDTVTITANAAINVVKSLSVSTGPSPSAGNITVTLTYTNTGAATATNVSLFDALPSLAGATMTYVPGSGTWSGGGTLTDTDGPADDGSTGIRFCASQAGGGTGLRCGTGEVHAQIGSVAPGASGTVSFLVSIPAGQNVGNIANTARFCYNDGTGVVPAGCTTAPGGNINTTGFTTNTAAYAVAPTFSVNATDSDGFGNNSTTDSDGANDIVNVATAAQGTVVTFDNVIRNTGNSADTFNITLPANTFPSGTTFLLFNATNSAPLTDSNGDGIPDTGIVQPGSSTRVFVRAQLPPNANSSAAVTLTKRATSVGNAATFNEVTDRLQTITARTVDLTNNTVGGAGAGFDATGVAGPHVTQPTNPGSTVTFTLVVQNTSTAADNYDLAASSSNVGISTAGFSPTLPAGWTVSFRADGGGGACATTGATITNTGNIAAGGNAVICAQVSIPANASAGTQSIYFRAASPASAVYNNVAPSSFAAFDVKQDAVTVNAVANLTLVPNRSGTVFPGGTAVYAHQLCNNGNTTLAGGSVTLTFANNTAAWTSALWLDTNGNGTIEVGTDTPIASGSTLAGALAAGTCVTLLDNVFAPLSATSGQTNVTTVTATHATAGSPSITDTSTVVSGDLQIVKEQRTVSCTAAGADDTFAGVAPQATFTTSAIPNLAPGSCVQYRIVATNVGSTSVSSLVVSDATPSFTTLETGACSVFAQRSDAGAVTLGGTAADEASGTVTATVATLPALVNVRLAYCVQLDQ